MKLGVVFPQSEIGNDPIVIRDYAQAAEQLGYDHVLVFDHVLGAHPDRFEKFRPPYDYRTPFHEPFVLFGYLAAVTTKLELTTGIVILPQRQTALVAKQAAAVDVLSGGRMRLGVGIGWNHVEYEALGENFHNRGRRVEEQIALMRRLWTEELVDFDGRYDNVQPGRHLSAAGAAPDPGMDGRRRRCRAAAHRKDRRRLVPAVPTGSTRGRNRRAAARLHPRRRTQRRRCRHRGAYQHVQHARGRVGRDAAGLARPRRDACFVQHDERRPRVAARPHRRYRAVP